MSVPSREAIFSALFARVSAATITVNGGSAPAFITASRRIKLWTDVQPSQQPALFQTEHSEMVAPKPRGLPQKITLEAMLYIYSASGTNSGDVPATTVNNLIDAVSNTLQPQTPQEIGQNVCTLGGLAAHCWIEGRIFKDPGDLDGQALAMIPVKILIPYGSPGP